MCVFDLPGVCRTGGSGGGQVHSQKQASGVDDGSRGGVVHITVGPFHGRGGNPGNP